LIKDDYNRWFFHNKKLTLRSRTQKKTTTITSNATSSSLSPYTSSIHSSESHYWSPSYVFSSRSTFLVLKHQTAINACKKIYLFGKNVVF